MHTLFFTTAVHKKGIFFLSLCLFCHLVVNYKHKKKIQSNLQVSLWAMRKKIKIQENKRCNTETYCKTWMSSYCNTVDHFHTQLKTVELETRCSSGCCWTTRATINGKKKYICIAFSQDDRRRPFGPFCAISVWLQHNVTHLHHERTKVTWSALCAKTIKDTRQND